MEAQKPIKDVPQRAVIAIEITIDRDIAVSVKDPDIEGRVIVMTLTPAQAREIAAGLLKAASDVKDRE